MTQMLLGMTMAFCYMAVGWACSCVRHKDKQYCMNDVVFRGKAVADSLNKSVSWESEDFDFFGMRIYTFQVDNIFWSKRSSGAMTTINITTPNNDGICGVEIVLNTDYLVAASYDTGDLMTDLCSGNRNWNTFNTQRKMFFTSGLRKLCASTNSTDPLTS